MKIVGSKKCNNKCPVGRKRQIYYYYVLTQNRAWLTSDRSGYSTDGSPYSWTYPCRLHSASGYWLQRCQRGGNPLQSLSDTYRPSAGNKIPSCRLTKIVVFNRKPSHCLTFNLITSPNTPDDTSCIGSKPLIIQLTTIIINQFYYSLELALNHVGDLSAKYLRGSSRKVREILLTPVSVGNTGAVLSPPFCVSSGLEVSESGHT